MPKTDWYGTPLGYLGLIYGPISERGFGIEEIRANIYEWWYDRDRCWDELEAMVGDVVIYQLIWPLPWKEYEEAYLHERPAIKQRMLAIIEAWQRANAIEWTDDDLRLLVEAMK